MTNAQPSEFDLVSDLEDDVCSIRDFARALTLIANSIGGNHGDVVARLSYSIVDRAEHVEEIRGDLFQRLNPNRRAKGKIKADPSA